MPAQFTITADPARDLIRIKMSGFFTPADIAAFRAARAVEHAKLTCRRNRHLTLNDISGMQVQAQDIVTAFQSLLADPAYRSRRLAFVISRTLARSQLMRALEVRTARCFEDAATAEAWLLLPEDELAAA
ncbi:hypothetical protein [Sphingomonas bacterium]|uniref:hypothetical protein n=1 Tax=Sphingomonas bacterium TaxID=1895847 RepID=UPI002616E964|nr:hypothetical protein [Sphingomonas bacterium]MDB5679872.1 hypothetical protein [Sphingomonas bacterium]